MQSGGLNVIQGPNGCGKSTLARTLLGLIPAIGGNVSVRPDGPRSWVPQYLPMADDFPVSVREIVEMGLWARDRAGDRSIGRPPGGLPRSQRRACVEESLRSVGLSESGSEKFAHLSGGQQRRALLARALSQQSRVIVLDEPMAGVDDDGRQLLGQLLSTLAQQSSSLYLVITHDTCWLTEQPSTIATIGTEGLVVQEFA
ncbi:MAG: ATP-binding cassette domain-containing protein [Planctomycetota bacterium]